jgi:hypothetical protein
VKREDVNNEKTGLISTKSSALRKKKEPIMEQA